MQEGKWPSQLLKIYALEIDRKSQSPFIMFNGQKKHEDEPIKQAQEFIEANITERILIEDLASRFAIGRRHFERRFKNATNNTPAGYMQRVKIEAAKKQLERSSKNVNEVMYDVGYTDSKAFRTVFKKITGHSSWITAINTIRSWQLHKGYGKLSDCVTHICR